MITFFRTPDCADCDLIEQAIQSMALAHKTIAITFPADARKHLPEAIEAPALVDGSEVYQGHSEIALGLDRLRQFKAEWDRFQSDACYCDEDGKVL